MVWATKLNDRRLFISLRASPLEWADTDRPSMELSRDRYRSEVVTQKCYQEFYIWKKTILRTCRIWVQMTLHCRINLPRHPNMNFAELIVSFQHGIWLQNVMHLTVMFRVVFLTLESMKTAWGHRPDSSCWLWTQSFLFNRCGIIVPIPWPLIITPQS